MTIDIQAGMRDYQVFCFLHVSYRRNPQHLAERSEHLMQELQELFKNLKEDICTTERITECLDIKNGKLFHI